MSDNARLIDQLRELVAHFNERDIRHALIGGLAVNVHGHSRATHDIDFLINLADEPSLRELMTQLGYEPADQREDLSSYFRGHQRVDFVHAHRKVGLALLAGARRTAYGEIELPVVSPEGLLGFKIQAFSDDPRRLKDFSDMFEVMRACRSKLNWKEVHSYFQLFGREELFDELKRAADADRD